MNNLNGMDSRSNGFQQSDFWQFLALIFCFQACISKHQENRFQLVDPRNSGIEFSNILMPNDTFNILQYMYFFNGGGVAVGDINQDGLDDLYFTGNQVSGRLYLNLGNLKFKDITKEAGVATTGWGSGVTIVDINADGWPDIYICQTGFPQGEKRNNLLFINQGDLTFDEMAEDYGLADTAYSTNAAFFDFDRDGDLDVYLLNHTHQFKNTNVPLLKKQRGESPASDRLLENVPGEKGHPFFYDISQKAGIQMEGFGLGISIADLNGDHWPDIYVSNDFLSNDLLYINQQNGTFVNVIDQLMQHQSFNGMGNDVADFNNDGYPDVFVADMLPYTNSRRKTMAMNTSEDLFESSLQMGYAPQYTRNTLQVNNGSFADSQNLLPFSEIGQMAGVYATDWSWAPIFSDLDNDGWKDLFITNGYYRDITDLDFITYRRHRTSFTTQQMQDSFYLHLMEQLPAVKIPNFVFKNQRDFRFSDSATAWGLGQPSLSNGAAIADLDNDGDLDIVVNNIDQAAFLYRNMTVDRKIDFQHYLKVALNGPDSNKDGIGAKVHVYAHDHQQWLEKELVHGYLSSVNSSLHFGLGKDDYVDSLIVVWPDESTSKVGRFTVDTVINVNYSGAKKVLESTSINNPIPPFFMEYTDTLKIDYLHRENEYSDFKMDRNLPFRLSHQGPAAAVGDLNGDGLEDLFIGGSAGFSATLFYQRNSGVFQSQLFNQHNEYEDIDALIFDADLDGDQDLYVVSGGIEFRDDRFYQDRLYRNMGQGQLVWDPAALPEMLVSGSVVRAADYDRDGDPDLFVAGRIIPGAYPTDPPGFILQNEGGIFRNVTKQVAPSLSHLGMVTDAVWCDYNSDGQMDIVLVGEWMPVTLLTNNRGFFERMEIPLTEPIHSAGWWRMIKATDADLDGDLDFVAGNLGTNTDWKTTEKYPATIYSDDFDHNGMKESLIAYYQPTDQGTLMNFLWYGRDEVIDLMPAWKKQFVDYSTYARSTVEKIITTQPALVKESFVQQSVYFRNDGGSFKMIPLPAEAQWSTINDAILEDFNNDGNPDLLGIGNMFETKVSMGRFDASLGLFMQGDGNGDWKVIANRDSHFVADGNNRRLLEIQVGVERVFLVIRNNGKLTAFKLMAPENNF